MGRFMLVLWLLSASAAYAQGVADVSGAQGGFEYTLGTLKESVARLSQENRNMFGVNEQAGVRLRALQSQLSLLQERSAKISLQCQGLEPRYQKKAAEQAQLELRLKELSGALEALNAERASAGDAVKLKEEEDAALVVRTDVMAKELVDIRAGVAAGEDRTDELQALREQQVVLQKELESSLTELDRVRKEWTEASVAISAGPGQVDAVGGIFMIRLGATLPCAVRS